MKHTNYKVAEAKQNPHKIDARLLYNQASAQAVHLTLKAGESLKPHITPVDVFFYVLEGNPTVLVGKEEFTAEKDELIESPAHIVHCIRNKSDSIARVLVVKAPRPVAKSKVL